MTIKKFKTLKLIIIVAMIMVAFFCIYKYGVSQISKKKSDDIITNMLVIQKQIKIINGKSRINGNEDAYVGKKINEIDDNYLIEKVKKLNIPEEELGDYYILNNDDYINMGIKDELKNAKENEFVINYKKVDVFCLDGINQDETTKYSLLDMHKD